MPKSKSKGLISGPNNLEEKNLMAVGINFCPPTCPLVFAWFPAWIGHVGHLPSSFGLHLTSSWGCWPSRVQPQSPSSPGSGLWTPQTLLSCQDCWSCSLCCLLLSSQGEERVFWGGTLANSDPAYWLTASGCHFQHTFATLVLQSFPEYSRAMSTDPFL